MTQTPLPTIFPWRIGPIFHDNLSTKTVWFWWRDLFFLLSLPIQHAYFPRRRVPSQATAASAVTPAPPASMAHTGGNSPCALCVS